MILESKVLEPEISVIIPTYNRLDFLKEAVKSVQEQSYLNFELIVVDDGSTDGTSEFLENAVVKSIIQENRGVSVARNAGIRVAKGKYITFLDSDDSWQKNKLQRQVEFMTTHTDAMVCYTDEIWIRKGVRVNPKKKHGKHSGWIFEKCLPLCIVSPSSAFMRKEFFEEIGLFDESLPACEDYDLWLRASLQFEFHYIPEKLIIKRGGHPGQLSANWGLDVYRVQALQKLLTNPRLTVKLRKQVVAQILEKCKILEQGFRKRGKDVEADNFRNLLVTT